MLFLPIDMFLDFHYVYFGGKGCFSLGSIEETTLKNLFMIIILATG